MDVKFVHVRWWFLWNVTSVFKRFVRSGVHVAKRLGTLLKQNRKYCQLAKIKVQMLLFIVVNALRYSELVSLFQALSLLFCAATNKLNTCKRLQASSQACHLN